MFYTFILVILAVLWISFCVTQNFALIRISGSSMHPTFEDGELLLFYKPKRGKGTGKKQLAKEGDLVLASVKIDKAPRPILVVKRVVAVMENKAPKGRRFVLHGDNLKESIDSRHPSFGTITEDCIVGKFLFKLND